MGKQVHHDRRPSVTSQCDLKLSDANFGDRRRLDAMEPLRLEHEQRHQEALKTKSPPARGFFSVREGHSDPFAVIVVDGFLVYRRHPSSAEKDRNYLQRSNRLAHAYSDSADYLAASFSPASLASPKIFAGKAKAIPMKISI